MAFVVATQRRRNSSKALAADIAEELQEYGDDPRTRTRTDSDGPATDWETLLQTYPSDEFSVSVERIGPAAISAMYKGWLGELPPESALRPEAFIAHLWGGGDFRLIIRGLPGNRMNQPRNRNVRVIPLTIAGRPKTALDGELETAAAGAGTPGELAQALVPALQPIANLLELQSRTLATLTQQKQGDPTSTRLLEMLIKERSQPPPASPDVAAMGQLLTSLSSQLVGVLRQQAGPQGPEENPLLETLAGLVEGGAEALLARVRANGGPPAAAAPIDVAPAADTPATGDEELPGEVVGAPEQ